MKKRFTMVTAMMLTVLMLMQVLAVSALSEEWEDEDISELIPEATLWGASESYVDENVYEYFETCTVGEKQALNTEVYFGYDLLDTYYVFGKKMGKYYGLSKVTYILPNDEKRDSDELTEYYDMYVKLMTEKIGKPDSETKGTSTWEKKNYSVEIGKGKFSAYTGYSNVTVGIVFKGKRFNKDTATAKSDQTSSVDTSAETEQEDSDSVQEDEASQFSGPMVTVNIAGKDVEIHKSFKDLMDSYEAFYDGYFNALSKNDYLQLLPLMEQLPQIEQELNDLEEAELTENETAYYIEVHARLLQKMALYD